MTQTQDVPPSLDTGERMIPALHKGAVVYAEHIVRYWFAAPLVKGKRVLDVASGSGYGTEVLKQAGATSVLGLDYDAEAAHYANSAHKGGGPDFAVADAERLPVASASIEVLISFETIEHLHNPHAFLDEVERVLVPGGLAIISTPNKGVFVEGNPFHVHEFTYDEFRDAIDGRFKNKQYLLQNDWIVSSVYDPETTLLSDGDLPSTTRTQKISGLTSEESLYVVCLCSDSRLPDTADLGVMGGIYEMKGFQNEVARLKEEIERLREVWDHMAEKDEHLANLKQMVEEKEGHLQELQAMVAQKDEALNETQAQLDTTRQELRRAYSPASLLSAGRRAANKLRGRR